MRDAKPVTTASAGFKPLVTGIKGLSEMTTRSVASLHRDDLAGRIPRPVTVGRSKRWRLKEIEEWIAAGCPDRATWEAARTQTHE